MNRFLAIITLIALAGCASNAPKDKGAKKSAPPSPQQSTNVANANPAPEPPPKARILPMNGRIAKVNEDLRFVIIDFTNTRQPRLEQRLSIYRVGQKVGEIKVSGPYRNTTVAADIIAGEAKYGDEVRTE